MITFLDEVISDILTSISIDKLKDCTIILPSRRAGLHFKKSISKKINHSILLPKITTTVLHYISDQLLYRKYLIEKENSIYVD